MTYQESIAKIQADTERIRQIGEEFKREAATWNPDINAPTAQVLSPAPDGEVDWAKVGRELDLE